jgi:tetratricopeptide (TPR) repeat protein
MLSRSLAEETEATGARRREDLLRVATWRLAAGEPGPPDVLVAAARRALAAFDFALAERLARAAAGTGGFEATHALADALVGLGRFGEADELLAALETSAANEPERCLATVARALNLFFHLGGGPEAERVLAEQEAAVAHDALRDELVAVRGQLMLFRGAVGDALELELAVLDRGLAGPHGTLQAGMSAVWGLNVAGRAREARTLVDSTLGLARELAEAVPLGSDLLEGNLAWSHCVAGEVDDALELIERLHDAAIDRGATAARGIYAFVVGWVALLAGRPRTAAARCGDAVSVLREVDQINNLAATLADLARAHALLGDVASAEARLAEAHAARMPGFGMHEPFLRAAEVWATAARGDFVGGPGPGQAAPPGPAA